MNNARFRVGIVGAGHISPFHVQAIQRLPDVQLVGVFDPRQERAQQLAQAHNIARVYDDYEALLRDVNVVHILTPPETHAELTIQALTCNCDCFVEKPLAVSVEECERIRMAASLTGRVVGVDHSLLADPFTLRALQLVERGKVGQVIGMQLQRSQSLPETDQGALPAHGRRGGDPFRDLGIHSLYQCEAFLGPIEAIDCRFQRIGCDPLIHYDDWHATIRCQRGVAQLALSWQARPLRDVLFLFGTEGVLKLDRFGMTVTRVGCGRLPEHARRAFNALAECCQTAWQVPWNLLRVVTGRIRRYHGLQAMVHEFYAALGQSRAPRVDVAAATRVTRWLEQVATQADQALAAEQATARSVPLRATILVTGGTGLIGGHLLRSLRRDDLAVRVFCRRVPTDADAYPGVEWVVGDLCDPEAVDRAVAGVQTIYHVGGVVHGSRTDFLRGNVEGTRLIVASALQHSVSQLIYVSSLSVLETPVDGGTLDETSAWEPNPEQRGDYTQTKLAAEKIVVEAIHSRGLPAVIVRPGEVIGAGAPLWSAGVGKRVGRWVVMLGNGELTVPLVNVEDVVSALRACADQRIIDGTILHLVDPASMTQNQLAAEYRVLTGESLKVIHFPVVVVFLIAAVLERAMKWMGRRPFVSVYRFKSALTPRGFNLQRTQTRLHWQAAAGLQPGLKATVQAAQAKMQTRHS